MLSWVNRNSPLKMMRFTAFLMIMIATISLTFTGCNNLTQSSQIKSPITINYTICNPLTINEHKEGDQDKFTYTYLTIEGLKDKKIQKAINDKLKDTYDAMRVQDFPPYRGIKVSISKDAQIIQENIYTSTVGNYNNILSVMIYKIQLIRIRIRMAALPVKVALRKTLTTMTVCGMSVKWKL